MHISAVDGQGDLHVVSTICSPHMELIFYYMSL
jgi:hypothetical protein